MKPSELKVGQIIEVTTKYRVTRVIGETPGARVKRADAPVGEYLYDVHEGPDRTIRVLKSPPRELKRGDVLVFREDRVSPPPTRITVYGWVKDTTYYRVLGKRRTNLSETWSMQMDSTGVLEHWVHEDGSDVLITD